MKEWASGTGFGLSYQLDWFKSRNSNCVYFVLKLTRNWLKSIIYILLAKRERVV